ncbi:MAG: ATP:cob(I)alamin adenosyltransferase [Bdellovibrionaceae bacterium]|nr:ATP:cob(I)alamin adenosyltransferase [Pseudobdellovibrionaceae bacterium]
MKIYTKTGDEGKTSLVNGERVSKTHKRLAAYGAVDELNSRLGLLILSLQQNALLEDLSPTLVEIQNQLFNLGSHWACPPSDWVQKLPAIKAENISSLEAQMDQWNTELPALREFILPGGSEPAAHAHLARTQCRLAERLALEIEDLADEQKGGLVFLNRLSDYFFVLARYINLRLGRPEQTWQK